MAGKGCLFPEEDCDFSSYPCPDCGKCQRHCSEAKLRRNDKRESLATAIFWIFFLLFAFLLLLSVPAHCEMRCQIYRQTARRQAAETLGGKYPWWYNLGQIQQESRCRADVTAFDGGEGLAQFMPATAAAYSKKLGESLDAYKPSDAIRMQALFLKDLNKQNPTGRLWPVFQAYNGGWKLLKVEATRAGSWKHDAMRAGCARRILTLKNGAKLNLCDVNYEYSRQVARYGELYRDGPDGMPYW